jgi:hypothetical protein
MAYDASNRVGHRLLGAAHALAAGAQLAYEELRKRERAAAHPPPPEPERPPRRYVPMRAGLLDRNTGAYEYILWAEDELLWP